MVVSCCVTGRSKRFDKEDSFDFHIFSKTEPRTTLWKNAFRRKDPITGGDWEPPSHPSLCTQHFISGRKSDDPNHPDYVPSINLGYDNTSSSSSSAAMDRYDRAARRSNAREQEEEEGEVDDVDFVVETPLDIANKEIECLLEEKAALGIEISSRRTEKNCSQTNLVSKNPSGLFGAKFLGSGDSDNRTRFYTDSSNHTAFL